jgi:phosphatidylethanolamine/phosphatidyl-N-methylethanolamine N-methyltransferase
MAAQIELDRPGVVIELGAGTGVVTRALLARGLPASRLVVVERDPGFCRLLHLHVPGVLVLQEDARRLRAALAARGIDRVAAVVSSLPLLALSLSTQRSVLRQSTGLLEPGGQFVQFTYGAGSPVHPALVRRLGLDGHPVARVWRNLPPAVVWSYIANGSGKPTARRLAA